MNLISAIIGGVALLLLIVALSVDELHKTDSGDCGWEEWKSNSGSNTKWKDAGSAYSEEEEAGQVWLAFGILSLFTGVGGLALSLLMPQKKLFGCIAHGVAGLFALIASAGSFAGGDDNICVDGTGAEAGASVVIGFIVWILFWAAAGTMFMTKNE